MTTKRFTITGERSISDHQKKRLYDLSDFDGMISVTERLNELYEKDRDGEECYRKLLEKYDKLKEENEQLRKEKECDKQVFTKKQLHERLQQTRKENEQLKKENYELHKRLGDFEPFEEHIQERTSKTSVNDIIGLIKTDEPTNSVELKKELYK